MGMKLPTNHFLVLPYKYLPATYTATQAIELQPWELVNLVLYARRLRGSNLVLACFLLQCAVSCIRFEHFQRSKPVDDHLGWHRYKCSKGKRRIRGARPGYEWATPEVSWQGFSMLKVLGEFYRHECLGTTSFLWPQVQLDPSDLWEIHEGSPFLVDKPMSRSRFLEIFRGALHQIGVPMELATTAGFNKLRRCMPTLGNVLRLDDSELQAIGSWVEVPACGGPQPARKSRATWLMGRHYSGGLAERSAAVKRAILQRFWKLFQLKQGDLTLTDGHLLPRGAWTWEELASANDKLPPIEIAPAGQSEAIEVEAPEELARTEAASADPETEDMPADASPQAIHDDDSSSTTSTSASDISAQGSDVEGVIPFDSAVEQTPWIQQGSKLHVVKATDDASRPVPWCREFAFQQDPRSNGVGFGTTSKGTFCQRCLARMPRGIYVAVAAQCGWMH
eukprot:s244_g24.t1